MGMGKTDQWTLSAPWPLDGPAVHPGNGVYVQLLNMGGPRGGYRDAIVILRAAEGYASAATSVVDTAQLLA